MQYDQLHAYLLEAIADIRAKLGECNVSHMRFDIEVSGRTLTGDLELTYNLGESYGSNSVRGSRLEKVIEEFLRRHGWAARNAPLCLPNAHSPKPKDDEEMPF